MITKRRTSVHVLLLIGFVVMSAPDMARGQNAPPKDEHGNVGSVELETSCGAAAQQPFGRGVALLHSFVWNDARRAFEAAAKADPGCAMAYWGQAMSYYDGLHEPPTQEEVAAARQALSKAVAAATTTDRERGYVAAGKALFDEYPEPGRLERDRAYSAALRDLARRFRDDEDANALYALSLLSLARRGVPDSGTFQNEAAGILEPIFARYPDHPGAAHYLIHAYDDLGERERGLAAARAYARIAPAVTHALHMPTHIFAGLGMWDETIASNKAAFEASDRIVRERGQPLTRRYYHGVLYWLYALLQKGDEAGAQALLAEHRPVLEADAAGKGALHNLLVRWYLDTGRWRDAAAMPILLDQPLVKAEALFVRGLGQSRTAQLDAAEATLRELKAVIAAIAAAKDLEVGVRARILDVQAKQLEGELLLARGRKDDALRVLKAAAAMEDAPGVSWAPPDSGTGIPAHEFLAEALLRLGRRAEAAAEFEKALTKTPGRRRSRTGLEQSRTSEGKPLGQR